MPDMPGGDVSPDMMKLMQSGREGNMPPADSPGTSDQGNEGERMQAHAKVQMAMTLLEQTVVAFGSGSEEGKSVLTSLKALGHKFGSDREKGRELIPSEVMNLVGNMPGKAGGSQSSPPPGGGMPPGGMPMGA
jgi:hypothetical protein